MYTSQRDINFNLPLFCSSKDAEKEMESLDKGLQKISELTKQLINYFCENEKSFKIEECISNLNTFCDRVKQCQKVKLSTVYLSVMLFFELGCFGHFKAILTT